MANEDELQKITQLALAIPGYKDAIAGRPVPGAPFPYPANHAQAVQNARWVADRHDLHLPAGAINKDGSLSDPNADHWYSDPRVLGPVAVATALTLGIALGPSAALAAPAASSTAAPAATVATVAPTAAEAGLGLTEAGVLPSTTIGSGYVPAIAGGTGMGAEGSTLATIGGGLKKGYDILKKGSDIFSGAGEAVGAATNAAGNNRLSKDELQMKADKEFEDSLMRRNTTERAERNNALDDVYRNSWYSNRQAGPNNARGITPMTPQYMETLGTLAGQGSDQLAKSPQYSTYNAPPLTKFDPTDPSMMEKIGTWAGPILSILGAFGGKK